jgi:hypothetical protein
MTQHGTLKPRLLRNKVNPESIRFRVVLQIQPTQRA